MNGTFRMYVRSVNFESLLLFATFRGYDPDKNRIYPRDGYTCSRCR